MSELLPCPFCGSKAWLRDNAVGRSRIECDECQIGQLDFTDHADAIAAWNRRAVVDGVLRAAWEAGRKSYCPAGILKDTERTEREWQRAKSALASVPAPSGAEPVKEFAKAILHGDDEHRAWLIEAADAFIAGQPLPPPRGKGTGPAPQAVQAEDIAVLVERLKNHYRTDVGMASETGDDIAQAAGLLTSLSAERDEALLLRDAWEAHLATIIAAAIRAYLSAARSTVPEAGKAVVVKPLEWRFFDVKHEYGRGVWDANHSYGTFTIQDCVEKYEGDNRFYVYHLSASFATLEAAQEAVYRQYEQRILSALASVPAPSGAALSTEPGEAEGWQTLPRFKRGDRVLARTHRGKIAEGRVCSVETHYGWQGHKPYHCYAVLFDGLERQQHLSDEQMIAAAPLPEDTHHGD